jgi:hypothetical protein
MGLMMTRLLSRCVTSSETRRKATSTLSDDDEADAESKRGNFPIGNQLRVRKLHVLSQFFEIKFVMCDQFTRLMA